MYVHVYVDCLRLSEPYCKSYLYYTCVLDYVYMHMYSNEWIAVQ